MKNKLLNYDYLPTNNSDKKIKVLAIPDWFFDKEINRLAKNNPRSRAIITMWNCHLRDSLVPRKMTSIKHLPFCIDKLNKTAFKAILKETNDTDLASYADDMFYEFYIRNDESIRALYAEGRENQSLEGLSIIADKISFYINTIPYEQIFSYSLGHELHRSLWSRQGSLLEHQIYLECFILPKMIEKQKINSLSRDQVKKFIDNTIRGLSDNQVRRAEIKSQIRKIVEAEYFNIYDQIAKAYYRAVKDSASENESTYFLILNTRQAFWGNRICWHDIKNGLISLEYLSKFHFFDFWLPVNMRNKEDLDQSKAIKKILVLYFLVAGQKRWLGRIADTGAKVIKKRIKIESKKLEAYDDKKEAAKEALFYNSENSYQDNHAPVMKTESGSYYLDIDLDEPIN